MADEKVADTRDGTPCGLCEQRDGYCHHHPDGGRDSPAGRPEYDPTPEEQLAVRALARSGHTHPEIAEELGIDGDTLRKHFGDELERGESMAVAKVAESFFQSAMSGEHPWAALEWLERRDPEHWAPADERADDEARDPQISEDDEGNEVWEIDFPDEGVAR